MNFALIPWAPSAPGTKSRDSPFLDARLRGKKQKEAINMHPAQFFVAVLAIVALVAIGVPHGVDEQTTGSIESAVSAIAGDAWTCEQLLYLEELELLSGGACS
jgi:hypothetical protein